MPVAFFMSLFNNWLEKYFIPYFVQAKQVVFLVVD